MHARDITRREHFIVEILTILVRVERNPREAKGKIVKCDTHGHTQPRGHRHTPTRKAR